MGLRGRRLLNPGGRATLIAILAGRTVQTREDI